MNKQRPPELREIDNSKGTPNISNILRDPEISTTLKKTNIEGLKFMSSNRSCGYQRGIYLK